MQSPLDMMADLTEVWVSALCTGTHPSKVSVVCRVHVEGRGKHKNTNFHDINNDFQVKIFSNSKIQ